ncbi:MAG: molybdate ABC transporter substrate-binding protein [Acidimicrobiia bacterium]
MRIVWSGSRSLNLGLVVSMAILVGCGGSEATASRELLVSAAASLTDVFAAMESAFEEANPDVDVVINLASSSALREQILEGAPVDVFASADISNMEDVVDAGKTGGEQHVFATNTLQIAVPAGNPAGVSGLHDFDRNELLIGLCFEDVPCGRLARESLENAGVTPAIDTNEPDVRSLLTKLELGELDAGITYVTDIAAAGGEVDGIDIPEEDNVMTEYPIAVMADGPDAEISNAFIDFVLSDEGQSILAGLGFGSP